MALPYESYDYYGEQGKILPCQFVHTKQGWCPAWYAYSTEHCTYKPIIVCVGASTH